MKRAISPVTARTDPQRQIDVEDLLSGDREVLLIHNGEAYRLRLTSNDRLILTK